MDDPLYHLLLELQELPRSGAQEYRFVDALAAQLDVLFSKLVGSGTLEQKKYALTECTARVDTLSRNWGENHQAIQIARKFLKTARGMTPNLDSIPEPELKGIRKLLAEGAGGQRGTPRKRWWQFWLAGGGAVFLVLVGLGIWWITRAEQEPGGAETRPPLNLTASEVVAKVFSEGSPEKITAALGEPHVEQKKSASETFWQYHCSDGFANLVFVNGKIKSVEAVGGPPRPIEPPQQKKAKPPDPKPEKRKEPVKPKQPEADKENVLYFDKTRSIARFTPKMMGKLEAGEELALFVLMAPTNGRILDDEIAAGHFRGDITFGRSPLTGGSLSFGTVVSGGNVLGDMKVFYGIRDGQQIRFGLSEEAARGKVSAAVGVKRTVGVNFRFVRFVTPISTLTIAPGTSEEPPAGAKGSRPRAKLSESEKKLVGEWTVTSDELAKVPDVEVLCHFKEDRALALVVKKAGKKLQEVRGTWEYVDEKLNTESDGRSVSSPCNWTSQNEFTIIAPGKPPQTYRRKKVEQ